jgi:hypothetical protein
MTSIVLYFTGLALVASAAWVVARPFRNSAVSSEMLVADPSTPPWQRRKDEALAAIREADFDYQLGKLSDADYAAARHRLERQAVEAIDALERGGENDA